MDTNQTESKIISEASKSVQSWLWARWIIVLYVFLLFIYFMKEIYNSESLIPAVLLATVIGPLLGYLIQKWKEPRKDALLIKLLKNIN